MLYTCKTVIVCDNDYPYCIDQDDDLDILFKTMRTNLANNVADIDFTEFKVDDNTKKLERMYTDVDAAKSAMQIVSNLIPKYNGKIISAEVIIL